MKRLDWLGEGQPYLAAGLGGEGWQECPGAGAEWATDCAGAACTSARGCRPVHSTSGEPPPAAVQWPLA